MYKNQSQTLDSSILFYVFISNSDVTIQYLADILDFDDLHCHTVLTTTEAEIRSFLPKDILCIVQSDSP